jgi:uncharacterized protein (DUF2147 family)
LVNASLPLTVPLAAQSISVGGAMCSDCSTDFGTAAQLAQDAIVNRYHIVQNQGGFKLPEVDNGRPFMNCVIRRVLLLICLLVPTLGAAEKDTPVGTWKTFDDKTGHAKSIVEIKQEDGELTGRVLEVLESPNGPHPVCRPCQGERKDQPVEGMTILWGARKNGVAWDGGKILDPENGKIYRVSLTLLDVGQKLEVHGYIGISAIGRSQIWQRQEERASDQ